MAGIGHAKETTMDMPFDQCLATISLAAAQTGVTPVNIVETTDLRIVRFVFSDGDLLVTCSRPDQKLLMIQS